MLGKRKQREWRYWDDPTSSHVVTYRRRWWRCACGRRFGNLLWACHHLRDEARTRSIPRRETRDAGGGDGHASGSG